MLAGQREDVVRVYQDGDIQLALLANGFECGFSLCWPPASRLILDLFEEAWAASTGSIEERLSAAFGEAGNRFNEQAPALVPEDADFPDDLPRAVLLAVATDGKTAHALWIGGDTAVLARGFIATAETTPHTLREQYSRDHPDDVVDFDTLPNALVRSIGPHDASHDVPAAFAFQLEAGDTIVLLSKANFRGLCVPSSDAAYAAAACSSPAILAEHLAELAFANYEAPYAATAVLRFDAIDVRSEIERLIDRYQPDPKHGDWLRAWSRSNRALPVCFDMGGVFGLKPDGEVLSVAWDAPARSTRNETSPAIHLMAAIGAADIYPSLKTLVPRRPKLASTCSHCAAKPTSEPRGCPHCRYLGWMPHEPPPWFYRPSPRSTSAKDRHEYGRRRSWWQRLFRGDS
jgi:hypothetical protein